MDKVPYLQLADLTLLLHFAFVLFVVVGEVLIVLGNLLRWHWVNLFWFRALHLASIALVTSSSWLGARCPLTTLESWLRMRGGGTTYDVSFIAFWVQRLLYYQAPDWIFTLLYTLFALLVAWSWWRYPPRRRSSQVDADTSQQR